MSMCASTQRILAFGYRVFERFWWIRVEIDSTHSRTLFDAVWDSVRKDPKGAAIWDSPTFCKDGDFASAEDAYARIRAGASLIQVYTGFIYRGPSLIGDIHSGLAARLKADGYANVADAVGVGA